jgi:hypothetical protein
MNDYASFCDDFYVSMNLSTEMELPSGRESVLPFFEQLQKKYPAMRNFYARDKGDFVLEQDKDGGSYRWSSIEPRRLCSGYVNPPEVELAIEQHRHVLDLIPYMLSVSRLDCEAVDLLFGFDFTYRGNHNRLVAEALGMNPAMEKLAELPGAQVLNFEPSVTLALDDDCRMQCRVSVESRTGWFHVKSGDFPEEQLSVYVTARQVGSIGADTNYVATLDKLHASCRELLDDYVIEHILKPLADTISLK